MIEVSFKGRGSIQVKGLYRYDYGQKLSFIDVDIPDGAEVDYYQGEKNAIRYVDNNMVSIPDRLITQAVTIKAYVYVREEDSGKTRKEIIIPVTNRPKPSNCIEPEDKKDYKRLLPKGGSEGQILVKNSGENFDSEWRDVKDVIGEIDTEIISEEEIDELFK